MLHFLLLKVDKDKVIDIESANIIYEQAESMKKKLKWYENSGHVITLG